MLRRWARHRHRVGAAVARPSLPDLPAGVKIRALAPASFRGAAAIAGRAPFSFGMERTRRQNYLAWEHVAIEAEFPIGGPDMVIGASDDTIFVWRASFGLGRPAELGGTFAISRIGAVAAVRHGIVTGVALALRSGHVIEFEAVRGRRLRALARHLEAVVTQRAGEP